MKSDRLTLDWLGVGGPSIVFCFCLQPVATTKSKGFFFFFFISRDFNENST